MSSAPGIMTNKHLAINSELRGPTTAIAKVKPKPR
jgi:hypothetical protein